MNLQTSSVLDSPPNDLLCVGEQQDAASKTRFYSFMNDPYSFLRIVKVPNEHNITFEVEGIQFNAHQLSTETSSKLIIWGILGYLPYTVTNASNRTALITILESARSLPSVLIGIDHKMKIIVRGAYDISDQSKADYLFSPIIHLMQEARPYLRLIGQYL